MTDQPDGDLLRQLLDIEEIKRLKARYFRTLDHKDWEGYGQVFAREGVLEVPEAGMIENGRDAVVAAVSGALRGATTVHQGHMPEIELTGPDTAQGTWAMSDFVEWTRPDAERRAGLTGFGHYVEEYVREDGEWRIARSRLERLRVDPLS